MVIRKISVGPDYKSGAMHYILGQSVLNDSYFISLIKRDKETKDIEVFIENKKEEVLLWKVFTASMPISIENNINFGEGDD
jgi:hypothetical protein